LNARLFQLVVISFFCPIVGKAVPLVFEPNRGQAAPDIQYLTRAHGYSAFLRPTEVTILASRTGAPAVSMAVVGARADAAVEGIEPTGGVSNYLKGPTPSAQYVGVPHFRGVYYHDIYKGIDLIWRAAEDSLEYDFRLTPGAPFELIRLKFDAQSTLHLNANGDLLVSKGGATLRQHAPHAYQDLSQGRSEVPIRFRLLAGNQVVFRLGKYDSSIPLVIDPLLSYASYLGGEGIDVGAAVAIDSSGNMYLTGRSNSVTFPIGAFPIKGQIDPTKDLSDAFVSKVSPSGNLIYSTFLGGEFEDSALGIAVDALGSAVVVGFTTSPDFPLVNSTEAFVSGGPGQCYANILTVNPAVGCDAFVAKLNSAGNALVFSALLGGGGNDVATAVALDPSGNAYVAGWTGSSGFPTTPGVLQSNQKGSQNSFVAKFEPSGKIDYVTLVGGSGTDTANGIAVDSAGHAYVVGDTSSMDFPAVAAVQGMNRRGGSTGTDAFAYELDTTGRSLIFSTFWGGSGAELGLAIALDTASNIYIVGATESTNFPTTPGVIQTSLAGTRDSFLAKFSSSGASILYSTYFGKEGTERADGVAVDANGSPYAAMSVTSTDLPVVSGFSGFRGGLSDGYLVRFDPTGANILGSTYWGGTGADILLKVALDNRGNFYAAGYGDSANLLLTSGAVRTQSGGGGADAYLVRVAFTPEVGALALSASQLTFSGVVGSPIAKQSITLTPEAGTNPNWRIDVSTALGNWLGASLASGSGTANIDITVDPSGLQAGSYSGTITVVNTSLNTSTPVPVSLTLSDAIGPLTPSGVVNGASFQGGPIAPGEIITIFAPNIGPPVLTGLALDASGKVATTLAETQVLFGNTPAALVYAQQNQIACVVPYSVVAATVQLRVLHKGTTSSAIVLPVTDTSPALFSADSSGSGQAAALNEDQSPNGPANAAARGSVIVLFGTGEGQTDPPGVDGLVASTILPKPLLPVSVSIGGKLGEVIYVGAAPGAVAGALQLNVRIPPDAGTGPQSVVVSIGTKSSTSGVTIALR
jgi:uncharacterized protein (TIGR03437 family)